jgi:hypothetical protein
MTTLEGIRDAKLNALFDWKRIDRKAALAKTELLDLVREACLIESYFAVYCARMMNLFWYDVAATSIFSIETYEAFFHYAALRRYLDEVDYRPVTDDEIRELREKARDEVSQDELRELVNFMATEHFAAMFFRDIATATDEPVLRSIMKRFGPEERVHSQFAADLIAQRIEGDEAQRERVVEYARNFRHIGAYALPRVSNVKEDNVASILEFDRAIETLVGRRLGAIEPGGSKERSR